MATRNWLGLVLLLAACQNTGPASNEHQRAGRLRQALSDEPDQEFNPLIEEAEASFSIPSDQVLIVPYGELVDALAGPRQSSAGNDVAMGVGIAEAGNAPSAIGLTGDNYNYCPNGCVVSGTVFIAPRSTLATARRYEVGNEWHVQITDYKVVVAPLTLQVGWMARARSVLLKPSISNVADSRCCGAEHRCVAERGPEVGGGSCGPGDDVYCNPEIAENLLPHGTDVSNGRPQPIVAQVYPASTAPNSGIPLTLGCLPPRGQLASNPDNPGFGECGVSLPTCDPPVLISNYTTIPRFWTAILDKTNLCLPGNSRPFSGVEPPPHCHAVSSPINVFPECRGHCLDCQPWEQEPDSFMEDYVPPHCAVATYDPENSSVCLRGQDKADHILAQHTWMQQQIDGSDCRHPSVSGQCCGDGCVCEETLESGWRLCQQCDDQKCRQHALPPAYDPLVATAGGVECTVGSTTTEGVTCTDGTSGSGLPAPEGKGAPESNPPPEPTPPSISNTEQRPAENQTAIGAGATPAGQQKPDNGHQNPASGSPPVAETNGKLEATPAAGDPVGLLSGDLLISQTDLSYAGPVQPLTFTRYYSSQSAHRGALGSNWRHNWEVHLEFLREGTNPSWAPMYCAGGTEESPRCLIFHGPKGEATLFLYDELTGVFMPQAGSTDTVIRIDNNPFATDIPNIFTTGWALRTAHGDLLTFDVDGYLVDMRDRFGNGFRVTQQETPTFTLWKHCKAQAASSPGTVSRACRLLDALVGEKALSQERLKPEDGVLELDVGPSTLRQWFHNNLGVSGPILGRTSFGALRKRPTRVEDDLGRALVFTYGVPGTEGYSHTAAQSHLLIKVEGPAGGVVKLTYGRNALQPADMNESYLTRVDREDVSNSSTDVTATPPRAIVFAYDWAPVPGINVGSGAFGVDGPIFEKYRAYFATFVGCNASYVDNCRNTVVPWFERGNAGEYARTATLNLASATWDNLLTVTVAGIVEAGTRFVREPEFANYDRVLEQRYGSRQSVMPGSGPLPPESQVEWSADEAGLPLATFRYVEAGPTTDPTTSSIPADRTEAPLPQALKDKYQLEAADLTLAVPKFAYASLGNPTPPGSSCDFDATEAKRRLLPGHVPSYVYFEDGRFDVAFNPDITLKRAHLTCEQIAESLRSNPFSNDNLSYLTPAYAGIGSGTTLPDGSFRDITRHFAHRVTGLRDRVAHDANRICQWTEFVDRDGNTTWHGLNFQGQVLVEAAELRFAQGTYRITERRFNADGNVVREFRPFVVPGQTPPGVVAYEYEEIRPNGNSGNNEWLPAWWTRRANLTRRTERLLAGSVPVESESSPGTFAQLQGAYEAYAYEPIYNQVRLVERGTLSAASPPVSTWHSRHEYTFDYQELSVVNGASADGIKPLLDSLRGWGIRWKTSSGEYDYLDIANLQLGLPFYPTDLNEDGVRGFPAAVNQSNHRGRGVPVHAEVTTPSSPLKLKQKFQWSGAGHLARYWDDLGNDERRSYYPLKDGSGNPMLGSSAAPTPPLVQVVERGFLARVRRRVGPTDYAFALPGSFYPCASLEGAYKYMLPSCSSTPAQDLVALGFSSQMADAIVRASNGGENAFDDIQLSYNLVGQPRYVWLNGQQSHGTTDVDGRPVTAQAPDGTVTQYVYDAALRLTGVNASLGSNVVRQVKMVRDDEGRVIGRCEARVPGACAVYALGARPANASVTEQSYTYEGHPRVSVDEAGVVRTRTVDERGLVWAESTTAPGSSTFEPRRTAWTWDNDGLLVAEAQGQTVSGTGALMSRSWTRNAFGDVTAFFDGRTSWAVDRSARGLLTHVRETSTSGTSVWSVRFGYDVWGGETERRLNGELVHRTIRTDFGLDIGQQGWGLDAEYYAKDYRGRVLWRAAAQERSVFVFDRASRAEFSALKPSTSAPPVMLRVALDVMGRPVEWEQRADTLVRTAHATRNPGGFIETYTGFDGYSTSTTRNLLGWATHVERQAGAGGAGVDTEDYVYNELGQPTLVTDPKGETTTYGYSPLGELTALVGYGSNAPSRAWHYDRLSRLDFTTRATGMPGGHLDYYWTGFHLDSIEASGQPVVSFERDAVGRPKVARAYNRGVLVGVNGEVVHELHYDNVGHVSAEIQTINGTTRELDSEWIITSTGQQRTLRVPPSSNGRTEWRESFNGRGQLSSKDRIANGPFTTGSFSYLGGVPTGRVENLGHGGSPLRHVVTLDPLLQPRTSAWTAVDVDAQGDPVNAAEGAAYCLGSWGPECAVPAFSEDLVRYSSGQLASALSKYGFPSQVGTGRNRWLAPFYGGRGEVVGAFDEWSVSSPPPTGSLIHHDLSPADVESLGTGKGFTAWTYEREQFTGALVDVAHQQHGSRLKVSQRDDGYRVKTVEFGQHQKQVDHDADGPVTTFGDFSLRWGPLGELAQVDRQGGDSEFYLYDAFGRLVARGDGTRVLERYVWDGHQMVAATGDEVVTDVKWEAAWGPGLDELLEFRTFDSSGNSTEYAPITDFRHNVVGLMEYTTRSSPQLVTYTAEGAATVRDDKDDIVCDQTVAGGPCPLPHGIPFGFNSAWTSTFTGFAYMRNRWYAPEVGEFLSHDPLGAVDSFSLYAFAAFDPINGWDPFGLSNNSLAAIVPQLPINPNTPIGPGGPGGGGPPGLGGRGPFQGYNPNPLPGAGRAAALLEREAARRVTMTLGMRLTLLLGLLLPGNMGQGRTCAVPGECSGPDALNEYMRHLPGAVKPPVSEPPMTPMQPGGGGYQLPPEQPRQSFVEPTTRPDVLAGDRIRKNWQPTPYTGPGCGMDCEKASRQIQKQIGGTIGTITPIAPNPGLGEFDGAPTDWTFHKVVIKDGRVFDEFTGSQGQDPDAYKDRFKHKDAIDFPF